jgi:NADH:ubiquinone oxidoreductase subunit 2 (subunit N)
MTTLAFLQGMESGMQGTGDGMQIARDLALLGPQLAVLLTAVGALVFEMLRLPKVGLAFTVVGLMVGTGLAVPLVGTGTTVFMGTYRVDVLSAVMIFGLTYWFGATGSTLLSELGELGGVPLAAGLGAVLVGLGYKAAIAPFHFWAPDATGRYSGLRGTSSIRNGPR